MDKKRFLWFLLPAAVFAVVGLAGVNSAVRSREASAKYAEQAASYMSTLMTAPKKELTLPAEPYVARVDVSGTIVSDTGMSVTGGGYDHDALIKYVEKLTEDDNNLGILLYIDSPGGEMKASDELYLKLMDYKKATGRPIYCYFDGTACSGGYYVAMASDEICADRNCICVNIGVYISTYNYAGLLEKLGVEQIAFKSSENKGIGMGGLPWTEEQKEIYQTLIDLMYDQFLGVVADGRHMTKEQVKARDDGREMLASQALEAGFIDSIGRYDDYESDVLSRMGTEKLYKYELSQSPWQELMQYFSRVMPRSDTQALLDFARDNSSFTVMAYAG